MQIRSEILTDPNARLDVNSDIDYSETEAKDAFRRVAEDYGWN